MYAHGSQTAPRRAYGYCAPSRPEQGRRGAEKTQGSTPASIRAPTPFSVLEIKIYSEKSSLPWNSMNTPGGVGVKVFWKQQARAAGLLRPRELLQGWAWGRAGGWAGGTALPERPGEADFPTAPLCQSVPDAFVGILAIWREMSYSDEV